MYKKYGKLLILKIIRTDKRPYFYCKCDCGNTKKIRYNAVISNATTSCGCNRAKKDKHPNWTGCGEIYGNYFNAIKHGAKKRNLEFSITIEYIWNLFLKQDRKCALSGIELKFDSYIKKIGMDQNASLDRIDSSKGYIEGNVQWIHKNINYMKQAFSQKDFINWCGIISDYNRKNNQ